LATGADALQYGDKKIVERSLEGLSLVTCNFCGSNVPLLIHRSASPKNKSGFIDMLVGIMEDLFGIKPDLFF